ncbi:MAG: hypothetical protein KKF48_04135 [Nanoarchaeota archaeon]|nr:hypothetical protein [Nanoarchaeota archaeon]MBU1028208.1 hypothetical protein [Nanoarchaeota archaeon]
MEVKGNVFLFGTFYDAGKRDFTKSRESYDIILYRVISSFESRAIGSLGGLFASSFSNKDIFRDKYNLVVERKKIKEFEKINKGKFHFFYVEGEE